MRGTYIVSSDRSHTLLTIAPGTSLVASFPVLPWDQWPSTLCLLLPPQTQMNILMSIPMLTLELWQSCHPVSSEMGQILKRIGMMMIEYGWVFGFIALFLIFFLALNEPSFIFLWYTLPPLVAPNCRCACVEALWFMLAQNVLIVLSVPFFCSFPVGHPLLFLAPLLIFRAWGSVK